VGLAAATVANVVRVAVFAQVSLSASNCQMDTVFIWCVS